MAAIYIKNFPKSLKQLVDEYGKRQFPNMSMQAAASMMILEWIRNHQDELDEIGLLTEEIKTFL